MTDIERDVKSALLSIRERAGEPSLDLALRIQRDVRHRRNRRRALLGVSTAVVVATASVGVGLLAVPDFADKPSPATSGAAVAPAGSPIGIEQVPLPDALAQAMPDGGSAAALTVPTRTGVPFKATTLSDDGTVVGLQADGDWFGDVVTVFPDEGRAIENRGAKPALVFNGMPVGDRQSLLWTNEDLLNRCRDLATGEERPLGVGPAFTSKGYFAWEEQEDRGGEIRVSRGCSDGEATNLGGTVVGFQYPLVFIREDGVANVATYDVDSGREAVALSDPQVPYNLTELGPPQQLAASGEIVAWITNGRATVRTPSGERTSSFDLHMPSTEGDQVPAISIGDRFVAFRSSPMEDVTGAGAGLLYDRQNDRWITMPGPVWAAGTWLAWNDGPRLVVHDSRHTS